MLRLASSTGMNPALTFAPVCRPIVRAALLAPALLLCAFAEAEERTPLPRPRPETGEAMCLMIESAARSHDLPVEFFARVIWQESRFRPDAIGPLTRSGRRAQGIAQFMPGTAEERGLLNPLDPIQALPKSAEFLQELRQEFGNLGLAAAAYNAGPRRVREWLEGTGYMPSETRNYVSAITGRSVDEWSKARGKPEETPPRAAPGCATLMAMLRQAPNPFVESLTQRIVLGEAKPWGVQISGHYSRDIALASYARALSRYESVLAGHDPALLAGNARGMRTYYRVRVGTETREEANALCGRLRKIGGACAVLRNNAKAG
jgi:hypothetical protein